MEIGSQNPEERAFRVFGLVPEDLLPLRVEPYSSGMTLKEPLKSFGRSLLFLACPTTGSFLVGQ